jgi:hypothetical protein
VKGLPLPISEKKKQKKGRISALKDWLLIKQSTYRADSLCG